EADLKKHSTPDSGNWLNALKVVFENTDWSAAAIDTAIATFIKEGSLPAGKIYNIIRIAMVGGSSGPHLADILLLLGKEETLKRVDAMIQFLTKH
ncbi:MAG TPA: hypothetical protein PLZ67_02705, partial [Bacteroidales bacterium]|nr:hypothetical protein [Bacteroidales bacterium]